MKQKDRIELSDTMLDIFLKLSDGNPGALSALMQMSKESLEVDPDAAFGGIQPLLSLDGMGIYGSHIWVLWKDVCGKSTRNIETLFRQVQLGMMSEGEVISAANGGLKSFDFPALLEQVQAQIPAFGRVATPA